MPELPEVETIRKGLEQYLVGHLVESIDIRLPKMFSGDPETLVNAPIRGVRRFGKGLVIDFDNHHSLAIHIKMTGQLIYRGPKVPKETKVSWKVGGPLPNGHTHVIFKFKNQNAKGKSTTQNSPPKSAKGDRPLAEKVESAYLYYNDIRQFGWMKVVKTDEVLELPFFKSLGPEPLSNLTMEQFSNIVKSAKTQIKVLLMDQTKIAGIGNIYANDALFLSKIHPKRAAKSLTDDEVTLLFRSIETVLKKGLEVGGASEWQYVNVLGQTGSYQNFFQVYGKGGKQCPVCGTTIEKITLGGRGTFYCPQCQK